MFFTPLDESGEEKELLLPPIFKKDVLIEQSDFFKDFLLSAWLEYVDDDVISMPDENSDLQKAMETMELILEQARLQAITQLEQDYQTLLKGILSNKLLVANKHTGYDPPLPSDTSISDFYLSKIRYSAFGNSIVIEPALPCAGTNEKNNLLRKKLHENNAIALREMINLPAFHFKKEHKNLDQFSIYGTPLINSIANTFTADALTLIQIGADINKYSAQFGNNPLLLAITKGWNHIDNDEMVRHLPTEQRSQKPIIEALLANHADTNLIHLRNGMSALHIACLRGDDPVLIERLIAHGAKMSVDLMGRTPQQLLDYDYRFAKKLLSQLLDNSVFGDAHLPENQSLVATIPTEEERKLNISKIKEIFSLQRSAQLENRKFR